MAAIGCLSAAATALVAGVVIVVCGWAVIATSRERAKSRKNLPFDFRPGNPLVVDFRKTHLCDDFGWEAGVGMNHYWPGPCHLIAYLPGERKVDMDAQSVMFTRSHDMLTGVLIRLNPENKSDACERARKMMVDWNLSDFGKLNRWYKLYGQFEIRESDCFLAGSSPGFGYSVQLAPSFSTDLSKPWIVSFGFGFSNMYSRYEGDLGKAEYGMAVQDLHWDLRHSHTTADVGWPDTNKTDGWQIERTTHLVADLPEGRRVDLTGWDVHVVRNGDLILGFVVNLPEGNERSVFETVSGLMDQWGIKGKEELQVWCQTPEKNRVVDPLQDLYFLRRFESFQCGTGVDLSGSPYRAIFNVSFR